MTTAPPDGYVPSLDSVLEAASLIEAFERHDPTFGELLFSASPGTTYALAAFANHAIRGFATLAQETPGDLLQQLRLVVTEAVSVIATEGDAA